MKMIGLIGGMSWESTVEYYRIINECVRHRLGGLHSARILMLSLDFAPIEEMQQAGDWEAAEAALAEAGQQLQRGGADLLVLCTNTMHKVAEAITAAVDLPLLHIADATAAAIQRAGLNTVGLLGTAFTMEQDFYKGRLEEHFGLEVLVPPAEGRQLVHRVIYDELCLGQIVPASRQDYRGVIAELVERGAQGIILGCTEISLLVRPEDSAVTLFDTTRIHAEAAVEMALE